VCKCGGFSFSLMLNKIQRMKEEDENERCMTLKATYNYDTKIYNLSNSYTRDGIFRTNLLNCDNG
jgi:hypothetical protein